MWESALNFGKHPALTSHAYPMFAFASTVAPTHKTQLRAFWFNLEV